MFQQPVIDHDAADLLAGPAKQSAFRMTGMQQIGTDYRNVEGAAAEIHDAVRFAVEHPVAVPEHAGGCLVDEGDAARKPFYGRFAKPVDIVVEGFHRDGQHDLLVDVAEIAAHEHQDAIDELVRRMAGVDNPAVDAPSAIGSAGAEHIHFQPPEGSRMVDKT